MGDTEDYYAKELVLAVADLIRADEFKDVTAAFHSVTSRAQGLAREKFANLANAHASEVVEELHEDSVRAQGGL